MTTNISQTPQPGQRRLQFRGDQIVFRLNADPAMPGRAFLRTNLGHARTIRREIIRHVEHNEPQLGRDWFDIPMHELSPGRFEVTVGLHEVGHFEAKCFFLAHNTKEPLWPDGPNTTINVEPADTCCGNIIYNAFVRQFGPDKKELRGAPPTDSLGIEALDRSGYTVIPPSGTFRDLMAELDFIFYRLGCRFLQLLPIHPTPTTYGRMGRFGSPYAALSFTEVDPALAVFDPKATPLEQFLELVDAVHARHGKLLIDIAINHTGWAARLHESHPQWLARNEKGEIENPGAWGVVWEDLTRLDYDHKALWQYMADVLLTWCRRGVDGFRCDAGYMIPTKAWQYMIAKVRDQFPDTIFFLEGLGGKISVTRDLLNQANFNWAYSELFQNYDRAQIEHYLPGANQISAAEGFTVHFAETHDNNRLAATSITHARMRMALCALLAPNGAFAFANGVEWFATQKINVHHAATLNWDAIENQVDSIGRLTHLLRNHPVFGPDVDLQLISKGQGNFIALLRRHRITAQQLLILANLDTDHPLTAGWDRHQSDLNEELLEDLITGIQVKIETKGSLSRVQLEPGQVLCLASMGDSPAAMETDDTMAIPTAIIQKRLCAKALEVMAVYKNEIRLDLDQVADELRADPETYCNRLNPKSEEPRVIHWRYPADLRRQVMVPAGYFVILHADHHFHVRLTDQNIILANEESLTDSADRPFVLLIPLDKTPRHRLIKLEITCYAPNGPEHHTARMLYLQHVQSLSIRTLYSRNDCHRLPLLALGTNGRGAMLRVNADWRLLASRYDALLAANLNPDFPEDRQVMLTRCRAWVVYQGYSQEVNLDCLEQFGFDYKKGPWWRYQIPTGQGEHIVLQVTMTLLSETANTMCLGMRRLAQVAGQAELDDNQAVTLIIRPDIEDRNFHHTTKAFSGPEHQWPQSVQPMPEGFHFKPAPDHGLLVSATHGRFVPEPEWYYMVHRPQEAHRGLDPDSDLFSPGYISCPLLGGQNMAIIAETTMGESNPVPQNAPPNLASDPPSAETLPLDEALTAALDQYVVRRGNFRTVIAGFPWFLDWGRDTLIVARGLTAAGKFDTVKAILMQFARFEDRGTLPNMIRGNDASNRDTSDAPLWFFTVCADLAAAQDDTDFLKSDCNGRSLSQVLTDMAKALTVGTPNNVAMDPESGLIFSPAHFTWMDTNYPAATPRQGYPIEIQALWYAALKFLEQTDPIGTQNWQDLANQVKTSIVHLFWQPKLGYLADCLHAHPGQPAAQARPDDALRPNQLLSITLDAMDDIGMGRQILGACQELLVPGAIRSLADRPVQSPLEIHHNGRLLNNPKNPYWGNYSGDEDTRRKPAYHNGTAWTWIFPSYCEAWVKCYGPESRPTALAWLSSSTRLINGHNVGHVPEIVDGDAPHAQRGCDAQAWGVSELLRVLKKLSG